MMELGTRFIKKCSWYHHGSNLETFPFLVLWTIQNYEFYKFKSENNTRSSDGVIIQCFGAQ